MGFIQEFKEFATRGNLVDLAVGVVIGAAFGKVVSAFINGMVMPLVGLLVGDVDFSNLYISLSKAVTDARADNPVLPLEDAKKLGAVLAYGTFITMLIEFLVILLAIFLVIKAMNRLKKKDVVAAPPAPTNEEMLLTEIRDALRSK
jgi:large conductance mechanosensitive channel